MATRLGMEEIVKRLEAAREWERRARAMAARLRRAAGAAERRVETQRRCCLGGALLAIAAIDAQWAQQVTSAVRHYLANHPPHASNAATLGGTAFDMTGPEEA